LRVLHQFIAGLPQGAVVAIATVALAVVGLLDYLTGFEISFGLFYLVPVCTVGWYHGRRAGIVFACLSSVVWYGVELAGGYPYHHALIPVWNAAVRFGFFVIIALLVAALRGRLAAERRLARTDALTGVMNKRAFAEQLDRDLALARRLGMPIALAYVDLDDFKQANELYGHAGGDEVLRMVGDALSAGTRITDTVARLGGDEFALILPGADLEGARCLIMDLKILLDASQDHHGPQVSCSIGVMVFEDAPPSASEAVAAADRLMFDAKSAGKNQTIFGVHPGGDAQTSGRQRSERVRTARSNRGTNRRHRSFR
jgi:diguanylate cyclase (GGDEF)-like protein